MPYNATLLCITDDVGIRVWLERSLQDHWNIEFVGGSVLLRIVNLIEAAAAPLAIVAIDENDPEKAVRTIEAIVNGYSASVPVVTVTRRLHQDTLLRCMRAGARDCLLVDSDMEELRGQIERILLKKNDSYPQDEARNTPKNLTMVASPSATVDTCFLTQSLTFAIHEHDPQQKILAIDTAAEGRYLFYLEVNNRFGLKNFLANFNSTDERLIDTALEEYLPGVRLMGGRLNDEDVRGDRSIDLFIAISQLMHNFDHIIINVDFQCSDLWIKTLGPQASHLIFAAHPIVNQIHHTRDLLHSWQTNLAKGAQQMMLIDGYESGDGTPSVAQLETALGCPVFATLPLDWSNRLMSINSGTPINKLPYSTVYGKQLNKLVESIRGKPASEKPPLHKPSFFRSLGLRVST